MAKCNQLTPLPF